MNTGQMLLTTLALVLMGTTVLTVNKMYNNHEDVLRQTEIGIYAVSLATSLIEDASGKSFDETTVDDVITSTNLLSSQLGPETGETTTPPSATNFNDFDDYNGLTMGLFVANVDSFTISATVAYVDTLAPDAPVSNKKTWYKKLSVSVKGTAMTDTIKMSYIFSYFNFR